MTTIPVDHPDYASPIVAGGLMLGSLQINGVTNGTNARTAIIDVTSFSQVLVSIAMPATGPHTITVTWNASPTIPALSAPNPQYFHNGGSQVNIVADPLAPYMYVAILNNSGGTESYTVNVFGLTEHQSPGLILPPSMAPGFASLVAASTIVNGTPFSFPQGPGVVLGNVQTANVTVQLQAWNGSGWAPISGVWLNPNLIGTAPVVVPWCDLRWVINNMVAAPNTILANLTGSGL